MPDDEKAKVTDEALDAAAAEVSDDETKEPEAQEGSELQADVDAEEESVETDENQEKSVLDDQRIKSALGRVTSMQSRMDSFENMLKQLLEKTDKPNENQDEDSDDFISSKEALFKAMDEHQKKRQEEVSKYSEKAINAMLDIGIQYDDLDDQAYVTIHKDAEKNWRRVTGNPVQDAEINFDKAMNRYLKTQLAASKKKVNPLDKNKDKETKELGGPTETTVKQKTESIPELDDYAKEFIEKSGMKPDSVRAALKGDMPSYLGGR